MPTRSVSAGDDGRIVAAALARQEGDQRATREAARQPANESDDRVEIDEGENERDGRFQHEGSHPRRDHVDGKAGKVTMRGSYA
jgi:hypothetical protein